MDVAVEISLYPLQQDYLPAIRAFIRRLGAEPQLRVESTSMSTQIVGNYELIMPLLTRELRTALAGIPRSVVVMKLMGPLQDSRGAGAGPTAPAN